MADMSNAQPGQKPQKPKKIRKLFSPQEDAILSQIMFQEPFQTWIAVAEKLPGRTARQCRDRWVNYLSPTNKNGPWTHEEDKLLADKYLEHGPQWTTIAKFFDGRSENNVKNRWYTYVKTRFNQQKSATPAPVAPEPQYSHPPFPMRVDPASMQARVSRTPATPQIIPEVRTKPRLPPITAFDKNSPGVRIPAPVPQVQTTNRLRSISVQPYNVYRFLAH